MIGAIKNREIRGVIENPSLRATVGSVAISRTNYDPALFFIFPDFPQALVAAAVEPVKLIPNGVLYIIFLVILLCRIKFGGRNNLGYNFTFNPVGFNSPKLASAFGMMLA
jgi:hypothetical protein